MPRCSVAVLLAAVVLAACTPARRVAQAPTISKTPAEGDVRGRPRLGAPIPLPESSTVLVPFAVESAKGLFEDDDPYTRRGGVESGRANYRGGPPPRGVRWHNVIAKDTASGDEWMILTRRGVIGEWYAGLGAASVVVFVAVVDDTNGDGVLNNLDARVAIATDANARNPRIVTPTDAQVWGVSAMADSRTLCFTVAQDTNRDGRIDSYDTSAPWVWRLGSDQNATPLVSDAIRERAEQLLTDR
ncbi:MAG TPA: hypothetical protein VD971_13570 [Phycisphaerales bacterium]|nr:hypothetical protein [Phycisphaerales bacterium]